MMQINESLISAKRAATYVAAAQDADVATLFAAPLVANACLIP